MGARSMSATRGVRGNTANLLKSQAGPDAPRTGASCLSDTLDLVNKAWVRTNVSGTINAILADDDTNTPAPYFMNAGIASEFLVKRILANGTTIGAADIVLLT